MRIRLRGHAVISESCLATNDLSRGAFAFADDEAIPPGFFVVLQTGCGVNRWAKTKDGTHVYYVFMGRNQSVWSRSLEPVHVFHTQHTYVERTEAFEPYRTSVSL
ncbi:MAG: hypothetical protein SNJ76_01475 [Fimbriimonadaceae bacterium]